MGERKRPGGDLTQDLRRVRLAQPVAGAEGLRVAHNRLVDGSQWAVDVDDEFSGRQFKGAADTEAVAIRAFLGAAGPT